MPREVSNALLTRATKRSCLSEGWIKANLAQREPRDSRTPRSQRREMYHPGCRGGSSSSLVLHRAALAPSRRQTLNTRLSCSGRYSAICRALSQSGLPGFFFCSFYFWQENSRTPSTQVYKCYFLEFFKTNFQKTCLPFLHESDP